MLTGLLKKIVTTPPLHARWLNTFSYLEYTGFRKIINSQGGESLDCETLSHAVEESRHALLLKKMALKVGGAAVQSYATEALLCGAEAVGYFNELDRACEIRCADSRLTYLYVTWLVEVRALAVYGSYQKVLGDLGRPLPLTGLLAEEDRHLGAVTQELTAHDPNFLVRAAEFKILEDHLYHLYLTALSRELEKDSLAPHAFIS